MPRYGFLCIYPALGLLSFLNLSLFTKFVNFLAIYSFNIFFFPIFSLFSFWNFTYMEFRPLNIVLRVIGVLFTFVNLFFFLCFSNWILPFALFSNSLSFLFFQICYEAHSVNSAFILDIMLSSSKLSIWFFFSNFHFYAKSSFLFNHCDHISFENGCCKVLACYFQHGSSCIQFIFGHISLDSGSLFKINFFACLVIFLLYTRHGYYGDSRFC